MSSAESNSGATPVATSPVELLSGGGIFPDEHLLAYGNYPADLDALVSDASGGSLLAGSLLASNPLGAGCGGAGDITLSAAAPASPISRLAGGLADLQVLGTAAGDGATAAMADYAVQPLLVADLSLSASPWPGSDVVQS